MYLLLCLFSSAMAVLALSSWAAKQGSGFAVDELTGQITGIGDYRRAVVQAGAAAIGILVAILLSNIDYRSLVNVWPVHVVLTWGLVLPTLVIRNVTIGPLTIGYNAGDTDNYSWYKLGGFTFQPTELAKISFILTFAMHLNNVRSRLNEPKELGKLLLHLFVPIGIIHIQGDDGTAIIYGIIGCCMLFAAGLTIQAHRQTGAFTTLDALWESGRLLLWLAPAALWTVVSRSAAPLRHKPTLILALLLAMTCLPFYFFTGITAITLVRP